MNKLIVYVGGGGIIGSTFCHLDRQEIVVYYEKMSENFYWGASVKNQTEVLITTPIITDDLWGFKITRRTSVEILT